MSPFAVEPIAHHEGIPVFSEESRYTRNNERIAADHLDAMERPLPPPEGAPL
jgi:hypothetical protein